MDEHERRYQALNHRTGPHATPEAIEQTREFWRSCPHNGNARWLVRRMLQETDGQTLEGAANVLADLGYSYLVQCGLALAEDPMQINAFRNALRWIDGGD